MSKHPVFLNEKELKARLRDLRIKLAEIWSYDETKCRVPQLRCDLRSNIQRLLDLARWYEQTYPDLTERITRSQTELI